MFFFMRLTLRPLFFCFPQISNGQQSESEKEKINEVTRLMAERCASNGIKIAYEASKHLNCVDFVSLIVKFCTI